MGRGASEMADDPSAQQHTQEHEQQAASSRDAGEPTPERQAELRAAYEANVAGGRAPYASVGIGSRAEVEWIYRERHWSGELLLKLDEERPNLSGADLSEANLSGADLS